MRRKKRRKFKRRSGRAGASRRRPTQQEVEAQFAGAPSWDLPHCPGCDEIPKRWAMVGLWVNRHNGMLDGTYTLCPTCAELAQNPQTKYAVFSRCEEAMKLWAEARRAKANRKIKPEVRSKE